MAEQIGRFKPGENIPVFAVEQLPAGRLVYISADKTTNGDYSAKLATDNIAANKILGATQRDSGPTTDSATAWTRRVEVQTDGVVRVMAAAGITAGEEVYCSGEGKVKKLAAEKLSCGVAMNTVETGQYAEVLLP